MKERHLKNWLKNMNNEITSNKTYDMGGNILSKKIYNHTIGELSLEILDTIIYGYTNSIFRSFALQNVGVPR